MSVRPTKRSPQELDRLCVAPQDSLLHAMRVVDEQSIELAFVRDTADRIIGTISDGDIRRAILRGVPVDGPGGVREGMNGSFRWVRSSEGRANVLEMMTALSIGQVPVLDERERLVGLHLLYDLISPRDKPNHAVIMAGGKGVRLRPITESIPKPMVEVAGRPILERIVLHLVSHGVRTIWLAVNYLGNVIERHFGDGSRFGCRIHILREAEPRGTGGALSLLPSMDHPILVLNGDLVTQFDVRRILDCHDRGNHVATIGARRHSIEIPFGVLEKGETGQLVELREKPTHSWLVNAGIYVVAPSLLRRIPEAGEFPITELFSDCVRRRESVGIHVLDGDWIDVGQHDTLRLARGQI